MTLRRQGRPPELDTLLSVEQAAERLGTSLRFVRRLVFERRIAYVKLGRHVRIATHAGSGPKPPSAPKPERIALAGG
jgi:excisionase family DNA binding protein